MSEESRLTSEQTTSEQTTSPLPPPSLNLSAAGGSMGLGFGLSLGLAPLNFSTYHYKAIPEKVQDPEYQHKVATQLEKSRNLAEELRQEIREDDGIEPGSTPTLGNSGVRIVIKSPRAPQMSSGSTSSNEGGGGGGGGGGGASSSFAPPLLTSMKKTLSFGHIETAEIVKIKPEDEHKGEGHHSPTIFQGFIESERKRTKIESLTPSPSDSLVSSPIPK
jgi:hypothetical protein